MRKSACSVRGLDIGHPDVPKRSLPCEWLASGWVLDNRHLVGLAIEHRHMIVDVIDVNSDEQGASALWNTAVKR